MKKLLVGTALSAIATSAMAADLPSQKMPILEPVKAASQFNWAGWYAGVSVGAGADFRSTNMTFNSDTNSVDIGRLASGFSSDHLQQQVPNGFAALSSYNYGYGAQWDGSSWGGGTSGYQYSESGGRTRSALSFPTAPTKFSSSNTLVPSFSGELGYNVQLGRAVIGAVADFSWLGKQQTNKWSSAGSYTSSGTDYIYGGYPCDNSWGTGGTLLCGTEDFSITGTASASGSTSATTYWLSTARMKLGFAQDRALVYATGGLAFGRVGLKSEASYSDTVSYECTSTGVGNCDGHSQFSSTASWSGRTNKLRTGYALGAGIEYALSENLLLKLEGLYYDLGKVSLKVNGSGSTSEDSYGGDHVWPSGVTGSNTVSSYTVTKRFDGVLGKVGLGYKF